MDPQLQKILDSINSKKQFEVVDVTDQNITPAQLIDETPSIVNLLAGNQLVIPDGLLSYSIYNYGDSVIEINNVPIPSGMLVTEERTMVAGNLIGCTVDALTSACLISIKTKG